MRSLLRGHDNSRASGDDIKHEDIYHYGFNQDATCISVGTSKGYSIFNSEPFQRCFHDTSGGIAIVEMLFCTSLLALVGAGDQVGSSPRRLRIWNTKSMSAIFEMAFLTKILAVRLNRRRLVVCLETSMYIFDLNTLKQLQDMDIHPNPKGLVALSPREDTSYLAYPAEHEGEVMIHDTINCRMLNKVPAHKNRLVALDFSQDGSLLATASDKGTVIRVFKVPTGEHMYMLRRGSSPCTIYSLAFNHAATRLAVSSDKGTIHVFQLGAGHTKSLYARPFRRPLAHRAARFWPYMVGVSEASSARASEADGKGASSGRRRGSTGSVSASGGGAGRPVISTSPILGDAAQALVSTYFPKRLSDAVDGSRSFAQARLKEVHTRNVCALVPRRVGDDTSGASADRESLLVVTAGGCFYQFAVDVTAGGSCRLEKEHTLYEEAAESGAVVARVLHRRDPAAPSSLPSTPSSRHPPQPPAPGNTLQTTAIASGSLTAPMTPPSDT